MNNPNIVFLCVDIRKHPQEPSFFLNELGDKILLERVIERFYSVSQEDKFTFVVSSENEIEILKKSYPRSRVIQVSSKTKGSAVSSLLAVCTLPNEEEVMIVSVNEIVKANYPPIVTYFRETASDAGLVLFRSLSPKYAHVKLGKDGITIEGFYQYKTVSEIASTGLFYFRSSGMLTKMLAKLLKKEASYNGIFYIGTVINEFLLDNKKVSFCRIERKEYIPFKNESDFLSTPYLKNENF